MRVRGVLTLTGIVAAILGALVAWLVLSVPNDLRADGLLKEARQHMTEGRTDEARTGLTTIIQQYPRTDAAAAATAALLSLTHTERTELAQGIAHLRRQNDEQSRLIATLQTEMAALKKAAKPLPAMQGPPKPEPKPEPPQASAKKKTTPTKKTTTRRRR